jgi:hypothetical protein
MRKILAVLSLALGLVMAPAAAHASPVTYNLTLVNVLGNVFAGGNGSFTIDDTPNFPADAFVQNGAPGHDLTDMLINIGGNTFTLADSNTPASVDFLLGQVASINYDGSLGRGLFKITLNSGSLGYIYTNLMGQQLSAGTIFATPVAATPEPSSLILLGTGALSLASFGRRKFFA